MLQLRRVFFRSACVLGARRGFSGACLSILSVAIFFLTILPYGMLTVSCGHDEGSSADSLSISRLAPLPDSLQRPALSGVIPDSLMLTQKQADSLDFRLTHHYGIGFNFLCQRDSLLLLPDPGDLVGDTGVARRGDLMVVAQIRRLPAVDSLGEDTFLIKVATDKYSMGWVEESQLLSGSVPDDSLSQLLQFLTLSRHIWMSAFLILGIIAFLVIKHGRTPRTYMRLLLSMDSVYPPLLLALVGLLGCLYASVQHFVPEFWQEYYFHPTLNPLLLPTPMSILVWLVWLIIIVYLAMVIDVYNHFFFFHGVAYLGGITGLAMLVYLIISQTTFFYLGYVLLPALVVALVWLYLRRIRSRYVCGSCGQRIRRLGTCPHCGTWNE